MPLFNRFVNNAHLCKQVQCHFSTQRVAMAVEKMLAAGRFVQVQPTAHSAMNKNNNEHSEQQLQIVKMAMPHVETGLDAHSADLPDHGAPLLLADFGASHGANSSYAMSAIIKFFRKKYGQERTSTILVIHEDLPKNNWTELFKFVHTNPQSYLKQHEGVYALASGKGFHRQCLPDHSLYYGFSSAALQFLSKVPAKLENHCIPQHGSPKERELFERQAAEDWKAILTARSKELVKGGAFVAHVFTGGKSTLVDGHAGDLINDAVKRLVIDGFMTRQEQLDFNFPVYFRTKEEVTNEKFLESIGLDLISCEHADPMPLAVFEAYKQHHDRNRLAHDFATMLMNIFEPTFVEALSPNRPDEQKREICNKMSEYLTIELSKLPPETFKWGREHLFLVLKKVDPVQYPYF